jgi:hypothetical protein
MHHGSMWIELGFEIKIKFKSVVYECGEPRNEITFKYIPIKMKRKMSNECKYLLILYQDHVGCTIDLVNPVEYSM